MDPNSTKLPGLALPNPSPEGGVHTSAAVQPAEGSNEVMMSSVEVMPSNGNAMPPSTPPPATPMAMPVPTITTPGTDPAVAASVSVADDTSSDDLDAEWVSKAKAIVEQTKNDPRRESSELGKVKADYLRIRYNKNIKISEDQSR